LKDKKVKLDTEVISAVMAHLGRKGGSVTSERKRKASAANLDGKRTGRPRLPEDQLSPSARSKRKKREAEKLAKTDS
jgi:hypothetical protein